MLATSAAGGRQGARSLRLAAAREYAAEVVQLAEEQQDNQQLEERILGSLGGIVMETIDCLRSEQPFRSSTLSALSLELLSYLRQQNRPMMVNFACAFTMLMSELEGLDLAEGRGGGGGGGPRSYSNSIPDVQQPDAAAVAAPAPPLEKRSRTGSSPSPSSYNSIARPLQHLRLQQPQQFLPDAAAAAAADNKSQRQQLLLGIFKEEQQQAGGGRASVDMIEYEENSVGARSNEEETEDDALFQLGLNDDAGSSTESAADATAAERERLLQQMIANFSTPSISRLQPSLEDTVSIRSLMAKNQAKNKSGRFESRDEELAVEHSLPVSAAEIETMPDQEMAHLLRRAGLTEAQRHVMRQIRKRARSKISSREYRKRKEASRIESQMNGSANLQ